MKQFKGENKRIDLGQTNEQTHMTNSNKLHSLNYQLLTWNMHIQHVTRLNNFVHLMTLVRLKSLIS